MGGEEENGDWRWVGRWGGKKGGLLRVEKGWGVVSKAHFIDGSVSEVHHMNFLSSI